ncbi:helix-turn-helix transcriptional regulator [Proteiniphilum sp. X52]|uniref:helix-turn-helix domain-containing protein n=1 Tax=Proteiniphilum sp. X52 TaxID=2382159 RepID=UPI000F0A930E|nr:helix-turn-helix transcriptional regulator [Proteiniphilum sp. X52]RNC65396.1 XRE family transcriptional regulator [Proteiniphilum sp. X52]
MKRVKAFVERASDGGYSVYIDLNENSLNYGIHGNGNTAREAVDDFKSAYQAMRDFYRKKNMEFKEAEFEYAYDAASFIQFYSSYFTIAGLSRLTGINQGQLSHYVNGTRNPSKKTIEKIDTSIQDFAKNLSQVQVV